MESQSPASPRRTLTDRHIYLLLILVGLVTRLPFMRAFDMVTFDGTYYINTARSLMQGSVERVAFPVGYPVLVGVFLPLIRDGVRAAQAVSFAAGIGSLLVLYALARCFVGQKSAILCSVLLAVTPLFIRYTRLPMSESLYVFWLLAALLLFAKKKYLLFGFAMGFAAITRPEALPVMAVLFAFRIKKPKQALVMLVGFVLLFSTNSLILSKSQGRPVILPKMQALSSVAVDWQTREAVTEGLSRDTVEKQAQEGAASFHRVKSYLARLPDELALLHRHLLPAIFILALGAMVSRPGFLLAALVPFLVFPAFTDRTDPRWILPYVPVMLLYGVIGAGLLRHRIPRGAAFILIVAGAGTAVWMNRTQLLEPVAATYVSTREAALLFKDKVRPADKIADRKPYFAFYAGGTYVEIPMAPYEDTMRHLMKEKIKLLSLHVATTHNFRPALAPLLHNQSAIVGELRWRQVYAAPTGEVIYERVLDVDPLTWTQVTHLPGSVAVPAWSPDGRMIAFRNVDENGVGGIYTVTTTGGALRLVTETDARKDPIAWSSDGRSITFAASQMGSADIYSVDLATRQVTEVVSDAGNDFSPAWSQETLAFCSDRTGATEIWIKDQRSGRQVQVSKEGGNAYPAIGPRARRIAWLDNKKRLVILDRRTGKRTQIDSPENISLAPAWSPDGRFIAVAARDWGSLDVYIIKADGSGSLLLTKNGDANGMPAWSPTHNRLALVADTGTRSSVWVLEGIESYVDRLMKPVQIHTFEPIDKN